MSDEIKYPSPVAQSIEAAGNFLNTVKNPVFILMIFFMIFVSFIIYFGGNIGYQFLDSQKDIKLELQKQTDLQQKQSELEQKQINSLEKIHQELSFIEKHL